VIEDIEDTSAEWHHADQRYCWGCGDPLYDLDIFSGLCELCFRAEMRDAREEYRNEEVLNSHIKTMKEYACKAKTSMN